MFFTWGSWKNLQVGNFGHSFEVKFTFLCVSVDVCAFFVVSGFIAFIRVSNCSLSVINYGSLNLTFCHHLGNI